MAVSPEDSHVVYAGCNVGGFYKSTDGGASWQILNAGLHDLYVEVIVPNPRDANTIYIGTEGGVYRSRNGGEAWKWLRNGFSPVQRYSFSGPIGALAIDSGDPRVLYAGIGRPRWGKSGVGTVYRTADSGGHWSIANPGGGGMDRQAIVRVGGQPGGVYASHDGGVTWTRALDDPFMDAMAVDPHDAGHLYAGGADNPYHDQCTGSGVKESLDAGHTWKSLNTDQLTCLSISCLALDPHSPARLYAGTGGNGVFLLK
jgi:photosystem II stability/assembly factor-like uncharacterized protein